ncbi:hypothetical protein CUMW_091170 [Citrus unshiu]|nr:hypothetical protein CUMW_091170 [Citrus unshiu]
MASHLGGLIRDQNLNAHLNGASAGGKSTISKVPKKGALGGRKPLGDLSNSVNPTPNQSLKKQNSNVFSDNVIGASKSKIKIDGSKKKSFSRAPEKLQTSGRKALSDISNSGKSHLHEAPKKNFNPKLSVLTEEDLSAIAEEGYLHNHQECIKAQTKSMDIDELLRTVGLDKGFPKHAEPPQLSKVMPASPPRYLELEELPEDQLDLSPWKYDQFSDLDSPPRCASPKSPNHYMLWKDHDEANFRLIESP